MHEITDFQLNKKLKNDIITKLNSINKKSREYIKDILDLINLEVGINKILAIILFGSQQSLNEENTKMSDCDLLVIFKDRVSNRHIKEIEKYFIALEVKHQFREFNSHIANKIAFVMQQTTGMFISSFLTKKQYFEKVIFHKIFQVNRIFSKLFAPKKIVLLSALDNSTLLFGEDLRDEVKQKLEVPPYEMIKSIAMNFMISLVSIIIAPIKTFNSIKYNLEAVKWALRASNYYSFKDSMPLEVIIRRFVSLEKYPWFERRAEECRDVADV